jgi:non-specific serine/threonine protein kinase
VALTGVGGTGKTRLALQVSAEVLDDFDDGVWLVELAPLSDPLLVPQAIASAMAVREQPGRSFLDVLSDHLRGRQLLLLLDNCEHLIEACAEAADALLHAAPQVKILATSREALGIAGEVAFPVRSLSLPPASAATALEAAPSEAVGLFTERAAAVHPGFTVTDHNVASIVRICSRLDGIPLALELAAARVKGLSPEQIASRLDDRFRLLTGGSRTALPRQRTLEAAIDWSYKLLSEAECLLLRRLSVFADGWNLEAAEAVCAGDALPVNLILDSHLRLVDKSLIISDTEASPPRNRMLETIRQFAQERLDASGEAEAVRRQHAAYFSAWVEQMGIELRAGPTQLQRFEQLEREQGNIEATLEWSLGGGDRELGLRLVGAIFYFWWRAGHWNEWERWMTMAAEQIDDAATASEAARAAALAALCGADLYLKRDLVAARLHGEAALALYRELRDPRNIAWTIYWLNTCSMGLMGNDDEFDRVVALSDEALGLLRAAGELAGVAQGLTNLGEYLELHGDRVGAKAVHHESLEIARAIGDQIREHIQNSNLGEIALEEGDLEAAKMLFKENVTWAGERGNIPIMLSGLANLARLSLQAGEPARAARLIGAGESVSGNSGVRLQPVEQTEYDRHVALVRGHLADAAFDTLRAEGRAMTIEHAIEYALAESPAQLRSEGKK